MNRRKYRTFLHYLKDLENPEWYPLANEKNRSLYIYIAAMHYQCDDNEIMLWLDYRDSLVREQDILPRVQRDLVAWQEEWSHLEPHVTAAYKERYKEMIDKRIAVCEKIVNFSKFR